MRAREQERALTVLPGLMPFQTFQSHYRQTGLLCRVGMPSRADNVSEL